MTKNSKHTTPRTTLGFRFTPQDNKRIEKAKASAADFMLNRYGKGRHPYMIDTSQYI